MNLVPFESAKLPAHLANAFGDLGNEFSSGQKTGFPVISIKGKVYHIKRGDEKTLVTKPGADDEPAASIEVVVIKTHPGVAKTYYKRGYVEGAIEKPDCYSNDGVAPAADAVEAQAKKCATCVHNQWGARITEDGKKGKACQDVKRLAVAAAGQLNDPMLLRVPAASLKTWDAYVDLLKKRGVTPPMLVTKIGFDYTVAHPALTFKPVGLLTDDMVAEVRETRGSDVVQSIIGGGNPEVSAPDVDEEEAEAPAPVKKAPAAAPKPKMKSASLASVVDEAEEEAPKARVKVEAAEEDEAPAPAPKKAKAVEVSSASLDEELDGMLADLGFDDE